MELQEFSRKPRHSVSVTLGELLKRVGDSAEEKHHVLELEINNLASTTPSSFPFVLSFHNLSYSVKVKSKMALPKLRRVGARLPFGEAREGEIMAVLGASGSGKITLIDALADGISRESLKGNV
ncbi:hypothetical protein HAX54_018241 [Datura stramonium]|uniref:ABC transporter domain-containing protein n=1 Tax=Datura stramonium TaxID=4076 RepID=A0ABS8S128_DATST|nr:hypothetical protein [Datura stramonium]